MVEYLDSRIDNSITKNYLLVDISQREFFKLHSQKPTSPETPGKLHADAIKEIMQTYFSELIKVFENRKIKNINLGYVFNGDISVVGNMSKIDFVTQVLDMQQKEMFNDVENIDEKIEKLKNICDLSKFESDEIFKVYIDKKQVQFESSFLKTVLSGYKVFDFNNKDLSINGLNRDEFCYVLKSFIQDNNILANFVLTQETQQFINDIVNDKFANTYHFNKHTQTNDANIMDVVLNNDLKNYVYSNMPKNYSDLQKSIFVYIKLCKLLTYDPEFYANNQSGGVARQHEDITRLAKVSTDETKIVCYEFVQLYAKFLFDMGLNYEIDSAFGYGDGHADLKFRTGDFVISADSVTSIIGGDLYRAKINSELEGLKCLNKNDSTIQEFETAYDKVYDDIIRTEELKESDEGLFYDFLDMFDALCEKEQVGIDKKITIFEKRCKEIQLPTMDKITYMLSLSKAIFAEEIENEQFAATIISQKEIDGYHIKTMPTIVYSFNTKSFKTAPNETKYMMMDKAGNLKNVYKETIKQNFDIGAFKYITAGVKKRHQIPGIYEEVQDVR